MEYLDFELPIKEVQEQLSKCQLIGNESDIDVTDTCEKLEVKLKKTKEKIYGNLTPWQRVQLSRHPQAICFRLHKGYLWKFILELHGDRNVKDDKARSLIWKSRPNFHVCWNEAIQHRY